VSKRPQHRLCLALAVFGALLITLTALARSARMATDHTLPAFNRSRPALQDWPRHSPGPIA
jgi:hypothetical protein